MAELRHVERFTVTIAGGSTSNTYTLSTTLLDTSKAFVVWGLEAQGDAPTEALVAGNITNTTTLTFERNTSDGNPIVIVGYVAEFNSGVFVQRGSSSESGTEGDFTLTTIDLSKSFRIFSYTRTNGTAFGTDDFLASYLWDDAGTIKLRWLSEGSWSGNVGWQVVEYDDCSVQRGEDLRMKNVATVTDAITTVDRGKSFILCDWIVWTIGDRPDEFNVRAQINAVNQITFDRYDTEGELRIYWEVVEFTDDTVVEEVLVSLLDTDGEEDTTITTLESLNNSLALASGNTGHGGRAEYTTSDIPGAGWFTCDLTSLSNLRVRRGFTTDDADVAVYVVSFPLVGPEILINGITPGKVNSRPWASISSVNDVG